MEPTATSRDEGLAALRGRDPLRAIHLLTQATDQNPRDAAAWGGLGVALCRAGRVADGIGAIDRAISLSPRHAAHHFNRGRGLELMGRKADALQAFRRTLELAPDHPGAAEAVRRLSAAPGVAEEEAHRMSLRASLSEFALDLPQPAPSSPQSRHTATGASAPPPRPQIQTAAAAPTPPAHSAPPAWAPEPVNTIPHPVVPPPSRPAAPVVESVKASAAKPGPTPGVIAFIGVLCLGTGFFGGILATSILIPLLQQAGDEVPRPPQPVRAESNAGTDAGSRIVPSSPAAAADAVSRSTSP